MLITAKRIIVGDGHSVYLDHALRIGEDGCIADLGKRSDLLARYPGEEVISYPDGTLLPGLIDLHAHLGHYAPAKRQWQNPYMLAYITLHHAQKALRYGVTTLRDPGSPHMVTQTMQAASEMGYMDLPRIFPCDAGICITGGHGTAFGLGEGVEVADGPWECRKAVRKRVQAGCTWIKVMTSHRKNVCEFTQEEMEAIVDEAHRLGVKVAVHSSTPNSIQRCIDVGVDTIEHCTFMSLEQARQMVEKGIAWVPTILPYIELLEGAKNAPPSPRQQDNLRHYTATMDQYRNHFLELASTGVLIGAGTDLVLAGSGESDPMVARELEGMVMCGFNSLQAIQAGTANGARILGLEDVTGQIKVGLAADLLVVDGDPTIRIQDLQKVRRVFLDGRTVYRSEE